MFNDELEAYRKDAVTAAIELTYPQKVVKKIEQAASINQITNIMKQARLDSCEENLWRK